MAARESSRVLRHEWVGSVCLTPGGGMAMGASKEHGDTAAGRSQAVTPRSTALLCGLRAGGGRTGAVGGTGRVA
jgi:hypothetical protein